MGFPSDVATADLDGDGRADLIASEGGGAGVRIALANGTRSFGAPTYEEAATNPDAIAIGDLNLDGPLDIVTANEGSNSVSILLGQGDGTLSDPVNVPTDDGPTDAAIGDLNQDGLPDMAAANLFAASVTVLFGDGEGGFLSTAVLPVSGGPHEVSVIDLDGDALADIITTGTNGMANVLLNNGGGGFAPAETMPAGSIGHTVSEFNTDGRPDVAAVAQDNMVAVLLSGASTERSISFGLRKHLIAFGTVVTLLPEFPECSQGVTVTIEHRRTKGWVTVGTVLTDTNGSYRHRLSDKPGRYRAQVSGDEVCRPAISQAKRHVHP